MSSGFRSAATLREYFGEILNHRPDRSGLPSGVRGAGAARFGLPSAVRGIPGVGWVSHCAATGALSVMVRTAIAEACMGATSRGEYTGCCSVPRGRLLPHRREPLAIIRRSDD